MKQALNITSIPSKTKDRFTQEEYLDLLSQYGQENVDNDLIIELMILYPEQDGVIDADGRIVTISETDLYDIVAATNKQLKARLSHTLAKVKSWIRGNTIDNHDYVVITEDHSLDSKKKIGYSVDEFEIRFVDDIPYVYGKAHIIRPDAKVGVKQGLYREISATVRNDNTLKEISFVSVPALPYAAKLSEPTIPKSSQKQIIEQLSAITNEIYKINENIEQKESEIILLQKEQNIDSYLTNLIYNGKILPRDKSFYRDSWMKFSEPDIKITYNMLKLAQPAINLYGNETRNKQFYEGMIVPRENIDALSMANAIRNGDMDFDEDTLNKFKAKLSEGKDLKKDKDDNKDKDDEDKDYSLSEGDEAKDFLCKLMARFSEGKDEEVKKMLSEYSKKMSEEESANKTDGDLPDNTRLSETVAKLSEGRQKDKDKIKELEEQQKSFMEILTTIADKAGLKRIK